MNRGQPQFQQLHLHQQKFYFVESAEAVFQFYPHNWWIIELATYVSRKEGRILTKERNSKGELELELGQAIWHQAPHMNNWNSRWIKEKLQEPHLYTEESDNSATYRSNRNFIKPRQVPSIGQNENSTGYPGLAPPSLSLPKASASDPVTSQSASLSPDRIPPLAKKYNSEDRIGATRSSPRQSTRSTMGIIPKRLTEEKWALRTSIRMHKTDILVVYFVATERHWNCMTFYLIVDTLQCVRIKITFSSHNIEVKFSSFSTVQKVSFYRGAYQQNIHSVNCVQI